MSSSIPKEPRQMMINMMYLVLTALLALNVSAEILNAFHVVNDGINNSNDAVASKNDKTMTAFEKQMQNDPLKTGQFYQKAQQVQQSSDQLYNYIQKQKDLIVDESGGWLNKNGDKTKGTGWTEDKGPLFDDRNLDVSTYWMVEMKRGDTLQQKIQALRSSLLDIVKTIRPDAEPVYEAQLPLRIEKPKPNSDGELKPWTQSYFEMVPTIAAVTILDKFQNDIRTSESQVLDFLYKQINANDIPVDRIKAEVIAPTSYVMDGQQYKSDIFVAAYSSTQNPTILVGQLNPAIAKKDANGDYPSDITENPLIGQGTSVTVEDGMGKYTTTASGQGDQHYTGVVEVKGANGVVKYYPFDAAYTTAAAAVVVSPDKMNVFYIGVDNPVSISVPGFGNDKISAGMSSGTITGGKGKYTVRVTADGLAKGTDVSVSALQLDKTNKVMGSVHFRIKRIPDPSPEVGNLFPGPVSVATFKAQQIVIASLANFDFDVKFPVISFDLTYAAKRQDLLTDSQTGGAIFTTKMQGFMKTAKPGDIFYLDNIKAKAPDGTVRKLPSIIYKMM
jgi:hypothetical protein